MLADRFGVSLGWAEKLTRMIRQTGKVERPPGGKRGPESKLTPEVRDRIRQWFRTQSDLTLAELQLRLWREETLEVSIAQLGRVLRVMGLRLKKSRSMPPSKIPLQGRFAGFSGAKKPAGSTRRS
jgi:transposase